MRSAQVDVALSAYGKPYQTAVTLASLLEHSGKHIGKIWFQEELDQPHGAQVREVARCFPDRAFEHYVPPVHIGYDYVQSEQLQSDRTRLSVRYQLAWERTDKQFLFITHNDCLYTSDIVGGMLERLKGGAFTGVGLVGQCWNCPAHLAGFCSGDVYENYRPTYAEAVALLAAQPSPRTLVGMLDPRQPSPLPECRLNEFACLINLAKCRHEVIPFGDVRPFGCMKLDIGTEWFHSLVRRGHRFLHWCEGMSHSPFTPDHAGHPLNTDAAAYRSSEENARHYLVERYPEITPRWDSLFCDRGATAVFVTDCD